VSVEARVGELNILVMAKAPVPGQVKTRLCARFTPAQAARLAEAALRDTLDTVVRTPAARRVLVLDGSPGAWLPDGVEVLPQSDGGLDERIAAALAAVAGPTVVIGMDTPQLTVNQLRFDWNRHDAWLGPAADGGWWALGLREPDPALVRAVPMSTARTGAVQLDRLHAAGLRVGMLPTLRDVDTPACAAAVAAAAHGTRFAALHAALTGSAVRAQVCGVG
jgi:glycosyltransferase A (GT-A) superfamily protein (DUF2064 family)